jgi:hydrogenase/urease accessory protein HupE
MNRAALTLSLVPLFIVAWPAPAGAHLMNTGLGPFYDGLTHLFVTPEDLLPVIALALLAGLRGAPCGRAVLMALPAAWLMSSIAAATVRPPIVLPAATAVGTIVCGALVAAEVPLPRAAVVLFAIALGLLHGALDGAELATFANVSTFSVVRGSGPAALGVASGLFALVAVLAGHAASVRAGWARVAVRVAGSWIAAIGLLMLAWSARGGY